MNWRHHDYLLQYFFCFNRNVRQRVLKELSGCLVTRPLTTSDETKIALSVVGSTTVCLSRMHLIIISPLVYGANITKAGGTTIRYASPKTGAEESLHANQFSNFVAYLVLATGTRILTSFCFQGKRLNSAWKLIRIYCLIGTVPSNVSTTSLSSFVENAHTRRSPICLSSKNARPVPIDRLLALISIKIFWNYMPNVRMECKKSSLAMYWPVLVTFLREGWVISCISMTTWTYVL